VKTVISLCVLGALLAPSVTQGQCYSPIRYYQTPAVYSPPVYQKEYVHVEPAQVLVFVPTFTVGYNPPAAAPAATAAAPVPAPVQAVAPPAKSELGEVMALLKTMNARLDRLEQQPLPPSKPPREVLPPSEDSAAPPAAGKFGLNKTRLGVITQKCAACHTAGKLDDRTTLVLLDAKGKLAPLSQTQELRLIRQTSLGKMPPAGNKFRIGPLDDEDYILLASGAEGSR
jgi:hypothetical protein